MYSKEIIAPFMQRHFLLHTWCRLCWWGQPHKNPLGTLQKHTKKGKASLRGLGLMSLVWHELPLSLIRNRGSTACDGQHAMLCRCTPCTPAVADVMIMRHNRSLLLLLLKLLLLLLTPSSSHWFAVVFAAGAYHTV
jgi:hypothetical protein